LIFIDSNIYLRFFEEAFPRQRQMIDSLLELKKRGWLFVTQQIVAEVNRNKLRVTIDSLSPLRDTLQLKRVSIPSLVGTDDDDNASVNLNSEWGQLVRTAREIEGQFSTKAGEIVRKVSESKDEVSKQLAVIFSGAVAPQESEIQEARRRKEFGDPPGKYSNPIGDELSWVQYLAKIKEVRGDVWIVSADNDYATSFDKVCYLNPVLVQDLVGCGIKLSNVHVFADLGKALEELRSINGGDFKNLPTKAQLMKIAEEAANRPKELTPAEAMAEVIGRLPPGAIVGALIGGLIGGVASSSDAKNTPRQTR